jgi:hypothetical protein
MELILAEGKGFSSKLIKFFTGGQYSHVAFRYSGAESEWMVHSTIGGVQPEWWYHFQNKYPKILRIKCKFSCADLAADNLIKQIGHKKYGYLTFIGIGLYIIIKKLGFAPGKNPFANPKTYLCTEIFSEFIKEVNMINAGLKIKEFDSEILTPKEIFEYVKTRPDLFEVL